MLAKAYCESHRKSSLSHLCDTRDAKVSIYIEDHPGDKNDVGGEILVDGAHSDRAVE